MSKAPTPCKNRRLALCRFLSSEELQSDCTNMHLFGEYRVQTVRKMR
ncbi:hypothetical protein CLOSTMETH_02981 [[Clostridium] methylpentosum DSM 5476]|uniref:Uncharacterized protein n=1 Tax=[Clostridium] methylpentosum DSM 5476 TaxID=537013 RepID=C0EGI8_9FIRM|nr:hypothetical protein CLOSTMETH_02981 [[Clostridium] methylpentosum DSM 5476]